MHSVSISQEASVFHGLDVPEKGKIVGYAAVIDTKQLRIPLPNKIALISTKNRQYNLEKWKIFTSRHQPQDTLFKHLVFAIKYEGINLLFFKKLFESLQAQQVIDLIQEEPSGQYARKIWFLYEFLMQHELKIPNADTKIKYIDLLDTKIQYGITFGIKSSRHRVINNLPGTYNFCPLIFKTTKLENYISANLSNQKNIYLNSIHKDVLQRASSFLLLKDSKASFTIEDENPGTNRALRWGKAIGQAGSKPLCKEELLRLQQIVIENNRFTTMGFRTEGGFVGEHDRITGEPIPDHISARADDLEILIDGLIITNNLLEASDFNAVLAAALIAFGFVNIHPFSDGNGRIHRYLIHHILAKMKFAQQGVIFPVSASILDHIDDYRKVLEAYSHPLLDFIEWETTPDNNVNVINDTIDYYRYFDATPMAEFLYDCVDDTIKNIIPAEVNYLRKYDVFKSYLENTFEMPDKMIADLVRFLEQNNGKLSKRAKTKEFKMLNESEIIEIEEQFKTIMIAD
ncbi:MAG: Fic family protein [Salinivirgaceae bacterium]|nr:Fic family protein [Salinivirgaceae bacterium]